MTIADFCTNKPQVGEAFKTRIPVGTASLEHMDYTQSTT